MYKKSILAVLALVLTLGLYAAEQEETQLKGAHPYDLEENASGVAPEFTRWTLGLSAGFNSFDGDFASEMKHPIWMPSAALSLECNLTPMWYLGLEYNYDWYKVFGKPGNADVLLNGMMHRAQAYLGFDLISACFPRSQKKIFGWDLFVGGGYGWFKNSVYYPDYTRFHTADYAPMSHDKFHDGAYLLAGTMFDFNLGRVVSLGVRGTYAYYVRDDVDGRGPTSVASKNNDGIFDVSLHLRFKLGAVKKTHLKNISGFAYGMGDGNKNREKDTVVVINKDTVYMMSQATAAVQSYNEDNYFFVYFANNDNNLDDKALIDVQQIATRMMDDESLCAEIIGRCDNTGSEELNDNLGYARARNVRDELVEEYRIDPSRITYSGKGIVVGGRSTGAYSPNRRCDIRLMNCADFGEIKQANDEREAQIEAAAAQAREERVDGVITAPEGLTLAGIARKYYGNTYCWVFVYEANRNTLKTPNYIPQGTRLVIPDLTEEQLHISKRNAETYYENLK